MLKSMQEYKQPTVFSLLIVVIFKLVLNENIVDNLFLKYFSVLFSQL